MNYTYYIVPLSIQEGHSLSDMLDMQTKGHLPQVDIEDFISFLIEVQFLFKSKGEYENIKNEEIDNRIKFSMSKSTAKIFVSWPALTIYSLIFLTAVYICFTAPTTIFNPRAFYFEDNLSLSLIYILLLGSFFVFLHELAHMTAASVLGVNSKLGFGNRLWNIVAEADLSGILALPKHQRYFPLGAGMLMDIINISMLSIIIYYIDNHTIISNYHVQILQAAILQIAITLTWQFNLFLRTDVYYIFCSYFTYPNLDQEARVFIRSFFKKNVIDYKYYNKRILKYFSIIWVLGRLISLLFLFVVIIPIMFEYAKDIYQSFSDKGSYSLQAWDVALFSFICLVIFVIGMFMWIKEKINRKGI